MKIAQNESGFNDRVKTTVEALDVSSASQKLR
jgi:hypothetical protein